MRNDQKTFVSVLNIGLVIGLVTFFVVLFVNSFTPENIWTELFVNNIYFLFMQVTTLPDIISLRDVAIAMFCAGIMSCFSAFLIFGFITNQDGSFCVQL